VALVVRDGVTLSDEVTQCMNLLIDRNMVGVVLNNSSE
jgi:hypothetical protein